MKKLFNICLGALLALALGLGIAQAQQAGVIAIQQTPSRLDACNALALAGGTPTVNTQVTATLNVPAGQYAYICSISGTVCANATGGTALTNGNFTSTNLPSNPTWQISFAGTLNTCANTAIAETFNGPPLKSSNAGTNVTIVSPAAGAQNAYQIRVTYYTAP